MNERGKSDSPIVPVDSTNNTTPVVAESVEGRRLVKGNSPNLTCPARSAGKGVPNKLDRVHEIARKGKEAKFTTLLHHVGLKRLMDVCLAINAKAVTDFDKVTGRTMPRI